MNDPAGKNQPHEGCEAIKSKVSHKVGRRNREKIKILFKINLIRSVDESRKDIHQF